MVSGKYGGLLQVLQRDFEGKVAFIIGGGPSITDPAGTVARIVAAGGVCFGINDAYLLPGVRWALANDSRWFKHHRGGIQSWVDSGGRMIDTGGTARGIATTIYCPPFVDPSPECRDSLGGVGKYNNSGCPAYQVVAAARPRAVFLLGYDGRIDNGASNWHPNLNPGITQDTYAGFANSMEWMMDALEKRGDDLPPTWNANPDTRYRAWPKCSLDDALAFTRGEAPEPAPGLAGGFRRVIFHHLPKSGGSSICSMFRGVSDRIGTEIRIPFGKPMPGDALVEATPSRMFFSSHYAFCPTVYRGQPGDFYLTWIRHPLDMLKSGWKYYAAPGKPHSMYEPQSVGRAISGQLAQGTFESMARWAAKDPAARLRFPLHYFEVLDLNADRFDFIGCTERMAEDVAKLGRMVGLPLESMHTNKASRSDPTMDLCDDLLAELLAPAIRTYDRLAASGRHGILAHS